MIGIVKWFSIIHPCDFKKSNIVWVYLMSVSTLADLGGGRAGCTLSYGTQFFHFHIYFSQKALVSEVHVPPNGSTPPVGNPGSATVQHSLFQEISTVKTSHETYAYKLSICNAARTVSSLFIALSSLLD